MARRLAVGFGGAYAGGAGHVCRHALLRTEATGADRLGFCLGNPLGVALVLPFFLADLCSQAARTEGQ